MCIHICIYVHVHVCMCMCIICTCVCTYMCITLTSLAILAQGSGGMEASPPLGCARAAKKNSYRTCTEDVRAAFHQLTSLKLRLSHERPQSTCIPTIEQTMNSLATEFDVASEKLRGRKRAAKDVASSSQEIVQLKRQVSYQTLCNSVQMVTTFRAMSHTHTICGSFPHLCICGTALSTLTVLNFMPGCFEF